MALTDLSLEVGRNIGYLNVAHTAWITDRAILEADVKAWINQIYRDELFPAFAAQNPGYNRQKSTVNTYIATGAVGSVSTTTLVASTAIFTSGMVGLTIYNSTQEESIDISSFTTTSAVVMESTVADWDAGDTIYVLGQEFSLGGDASDAAYIEDVKIKYDSGVTNFKPADKRIEGGIYTTGNETFSKVDPIWYKTTVDVDGVSTTAIGILPKMDDITGTIKIVYTEKPAVLTDSDSPRLPVDNVLISGATVRAARVMKDSELVAMWQPQYLADKREMILNFNAARGGKPIFGRQTTHAYEMRRRRR